MEKDLEKFQNNFDEVIRSCQRFTPFVRGIEFQKESVATLDKLIDTIRQNKKIAIEAQKENIANTLLSMEQMAISAKSEIEMIILIKEDKINDSWEKLIDAQMSLRSAMQAHPTGTAHLDPYVDKLIAYEKLLFPNQLFMSTGLIAGAGECSICGSEYGTCNHLKGKAYMGEFCHEIIKEVKQLNEVSIVEDPASKRCRAYTITENEKNRDIMTWRESE